MIPEKVSDEIESGAGVEGILMFLHFLGNDSLPKITPPTLEASIGIFSPKNRVEASNAASYQFPSL